VADVLRSAPLNIGFRRILADNKWIRSLHLVSRRMSVHLSDSEDTFKWNLIDYRCFTVRSMYLDLLNGQTVFLKYIWKIKVPLKIRIFIWFLHRKEILTKDNLVKRN